MFISPVSLRILLTHLGRQRHLEAGTYSRGDAAATHVNDTLNRMSGLIPDQLKALHDAISHMIRKLKFSYILIFVRTSPSPKPTDKEGTNCSIERQTQYLLHMFKKNVLWHVEKAPGVSASKGDAVDRLQSRLLKLGRNGLVLTTRVDRMTRSVSEFDRLQEIIADGDHGMMSFLWDFETGPQDVCTALRLPGTDCGVEAVVEWEKHLKAQIRAPMVRLSRPLHQPLLWMSGPDEG